MNFLQEHSALRYKKSPGSPGRFFFFFSCMLKHTFTGDLGKVRLHINSGEGFCEHIGRNYKHNYEPVKGRLEIDEKF